MANRQVVRSADLSELAANPAMQAAIMSRGSLQGMITRTAEELAAFNDDFLGPGQPLVSFRGHQPPRQYDYPASVNIRTTPERNDMQQI